MPARHPELIVADWAAWKEWLLRNATTSKGVWLTYAKKGATTPTTSLTYSQALDEALCHGWIDSQGRRRDETTYIQRFTPRAPMSMWSKRNVEYVTQLEKEGRLQAAGREAVERAKATGRWDNAYAQSNAEAPAEFLNAIAAVPEAQATWDSLNKTKKYAFIHRLSTLRTALGREKRIKEFVEKLSRHETLPAAGTTTTKTIKRRKKQT